jgi:hypothetical protein
MDRTSSSGSGSRKSSGSSSGKHRNQKWVPKDCSVSQSADGVGSRSEEGSDASILQHIGPDACIGTSASCNTDAHTCCEDACLGALLGWVNKEGSQEVDQLLTMESQSELISNVTGALSITRCSAQELPGIQSPWGDRACQVEVVAVWSVHDQAFSWRFENWCLELQKRDSQLENLLVCSVSAPSGERCVEASELHGCNQRYLLVCRFQWVHQAKPTDDCAPQQEYYVISCPPSVVPLRFSTIAPTSGQLPWKFVHRHVLPLPSQN